MIVDGRTVVLCVLSDVVSVMVIRIHIYSTVSHPYG